MIVGVADTTVTLLSGTRRLQLPDDRDPEEVCAGGARSRARIEPAGGHELRGDYRVHGCRVWSMAEVSLELKHHAWQNH